MTNFKSLLSLPFLDLFSIIVYSLPVSHPGNHNTHTTHQRPSILTMAYARAPMRIRERGREFTPWGGRGIPRGGARNAVELVPRLIATHMSTLHDGNSTTDDTLDASVQVMPTHHAFHNTTVRQKHVENVCGGLIIRNSPTSPKHLLTTFTPDSLAKQRRNHYTATEALSKPHLQETTNSIYNS